MACLNKKNRYKEAISYVVIIQISESESRPGKRRRRAISPVVQEPNSNRPRLDPDLVTLSNLSIGDRELVQNAAARDISIEDWDNTHARVINRRHAVSEIYPVPQEVIHTSYF